MTRVLLLGKHGQLGHALLQQLKDKFELTAPGSDELDLRIPDDIRDRVRSLKPQIIINAAAYTAVDQAESEPDLAAAINVHAPAILAEEIGTLGGAILHYSTDYVFDGIATRPYRELDACHPVSVYGQTKREGELAIQASGVPYFIFRTSWVYGVRGRNFLLTMLRLLREREQVRVVDNQVGAPTSVGSLAEATLRILTREANVLDTFTRHAGLYHMSCGGKTSWYGFACAIAEYMRVQGVPVAEILPIPDTEYPTPARRPAWSVLDNTRLQQTFGVYLPDWREALDQVMAEI
jgi:dTDP-4-dehydrorhamnose reductase